MPRIVWSLGVKCFFFYMEQRRQRVGRAGEWRVPLSRRRGRRYVRCSVRRFPWLSRWVRWRMWVNDMSKLNCIFTLGYILCIVRLYDLYHVSLRILISKCFAKCYRNIRVITRDYFCAHCIFLSHCWTKFWFCLIRFYILKKILDWYLLVFILICRTFPSLADKWKSFMRLTLFIRDVSQNLWLLTC